MDTATRLLIGGLLCFFTTTSLLGADDTANKEADAKCNHPGRSFKNLTGNAAWFAFPDPKAVYHEGNHKRTYFAWVTKAAEIRVGCYDHQTREVATATVRVNLNPDAQSAPAILVRPDGRLMVFYSMHYGKEASLYRISDRPEDISSWGPEMRAPTEGVYSDFINVVQLAKENHRIYLFRRGDNFSTSDDASHWSPARRLIERWKEKGGHEPYLKVASNGQDTIHMAFTDAHPSELDNSVYYCCYRDGAFYRADGSKITDVEHLPIKPAEADKVYDAKRSGVTAWLWDIAVDGSGNPVIVYVAYHNIATDHRYRYARWNGKKWEDREITPAGPGFPDKVPVCSGGITLDHADPSIVYLSKPTNGVFEIEKWMTPDGGATWISKNVTSGSKKNNVRPVVPRGHRPGDPVGLIWMYGDYAHWRGEYGTVLKVK